MVLEYNALQKRRGPDFRLLLSYFRSTNNRLSVNQLCIELCTYRMFDRKSRDLDGMLSINQLDSAMLPVHVSSVRLRNQEVWTSLTFFKSYSGVLHVRVFVWRSRGLDSGLLLPGSNHIQGIIDETETVHLSSSHPISRDNVIMHGRTVYKEGSLFLSNVPLDLYENQTTRPCE